MSQKKLETFMVGIVCKGNLYICILKDFEEVKCKILYHIQILIRGYDPVDLILNCKIVSLSNPELT